VSTSKDSIVYLTPSELARAILTLKGKPLNLHDYLPFQIIYDISPPEMTLIAGRQIGKSVSMGASIVSNSLVRPHFNTLYTSPLSQQTSRFSTGYLDPFLNSPIIRRHFIDSGSIKNIFTKSFTTGSTVTLGYAQTEQDADRIRGIFADALYMDEIQDSSIEAIPILAETLGASDYAYKRYTGTAKTENNTLTIMYKRSNMMEWVTKCDHCGKYTIPLDFDTCLKMVECEEGPGCVYCGKPLDLFKGKWMAAKPNVKNHIGFHLPQVIFPARAKPRKWTEIRDKVLTGGYSAQKIANEVFGVPSGVGGRILSLREAMACCNPSKTQWDEGFPPSGDPRSITTTVIGVDWSVSGSTQSYTIVSVLGFDYMGKCYLLYSQKLDGVDILDQVQRVLELFRKFKCSAIGSDRGVGVLQGQLMQEALGRERVHMINYVTAKNALRWDKADNFYAADRTRAIDMMMILFKMGIHKFETPCWNLMEPFWNDALNVFEEESLAGRRLYRKDPDVTDDWLHSTVFGNIAFMILKGEFTYVEEGAIPGTSSLDEIGY